MHAELHCLIKSIVVWLAHGMHLYSFIKIDFIFFPPLNFFVLFHAVRIHTSLGSEMKGCHLWLICVVTELLDLIWHLVWLWQEPAQTKVVCHDPTRMSYAWAVVFLCLFLFLYLNDLVSACVSIMTNDSVAR